MRSTLLLVISVVFSFTQSELHGDHSHWTECSMVPRKEIGLKPACCGNELFDLSQQLCCAGRVRDNGNRMRPSCCGEQVFDKNVDLCCDRVVHTNTPVTQQCCGQRVYDTESFACCDSKNQTVRVKGHC